MTEIRECGQVLVEILYVYGASFGRPFRDPLSRDLVFDQISSASCALRLTGSSDPPARLGIGFVLGAPPAPKCWTGIVDPPFAHVPPSNNARLLRRLLNELQAPPCASLVLSPKSGRVLRGGAGCRPENPPSPQLLSFAGFGGGFCEQFWERLNLNNLSSGGR